MNIIKIYGGLGNQMLQYALYISMREQGIKCKMDVFDLDNYLKSYNRDSIFRNFNVKEDFATFEESNRLGDLKKDIFNRIRRKIFGKKSTHFVQKYSRDYLPEIFGFNNTYLEGYWFNIKYFIKYIDILRIDFSPKNQITGNNLENLNLIEKCENSVGIHVRLGDAINQKNYSSFGGICTMDYYTKAIDIIKNKLSNYHFFVFSNEPHKCKEMFIGKEFTFIENNNEFAGYLDLILMSRCKHNIIANSTFSFWSALLNVNNNIVIAPIRFSNILNNKNDNCPDDWIRI